MTPSSEIPPSPARIRHFPIMALIFWLALVVAVVVPLFTQVQPTGLAVATVVVAILVGAAAFVYLDSYADTRAEIERARSYLADRSGGRKADLHG